MRRLNPAHYLLLFCLLFPAWAAAFSPAVQIKVESDWYGADLKDVQAVLNSTSAVLTPYLAGRTLSNIIVRNEEKGPISLYERGPNDEYVVVLDVKGRYWAQLAYQFSHEMCHLLSNYDLAPNNITHQQWFEESLCEAFSLFALEQLADQWEVNPPYANWKDYAPEIRKYAQSMRLQKHRGIEPAFSQWYQQQQKTLEENPYANDRELNEKMAAYLLQVFENEPQQWAAMNFINLGDDTTDKSLHKYLHDWLEHAPENLREPVIKIIKLLGVDEGENTQKSG